ncbi:hypothetical protein ACHAPO_011664 [Fusarium lateritium]
MYDTFPEQVIGSADRQYDELTFQRRIHFRMETRRWLRNIRRLPQLWKNQAKAESFGNLEKSGKVENSGLTTKEYAKLCEEKIENCDSMISRLESDNDVFVEKIEDLKSNPVSAMSDLRIERWEASIEIRKNVIADIEKKKLKLVEKKNELTELEYSDHWILHMRACAKLDGGNT